MAETSVDSSKFGLWKYYHIGSDKNRRTQVAISNSVLSTAPIGFEEYVNDKPNAQSGHITWAISNEEYNSFEIESLKFVFTNQSSFRNFKVHVWLVDIDENDKTKFISTPLAPNNSGGSEGVSYVSEKEMQHTYVIPKQYYKNKQNVIFSIKFSKVGNDQQLAIAFKVTDVWLEMAYRTKTSVSKISYIESALDTPQKIRIENDDSEAKHDIVWSFYDPDHANIVASKSELKTRDRLPQCQLEYSEFKDLCYQYYVKGLSSVHCSATVKTYTRDLILADENPNGQQIQFEVPIPDKEEETRPSIPNMDVDVRHEYQYTDLGRRFSEEYGGLLQRNVNISIRAPGARNKWFSDYEAYRSMQQEGIEVKYEQKDSQSDFMNYNEPYLIHLDTEADDYIIRITVRNKWGFTSSHDYHIGKVYKNGGIYFTSYDFYRCDVDGNRKEEGEYVKIMAKGGQYLSSIDHFDARMKTKIEGSIWSDYVIMDKEDNMLGYKYCITGDGELDPETEYQIEIRATDEFGQTESFIVDLYTSEFTLYRLAGGKGVAFGTAATHYGVEIAQHWPLYTHGMEIEELIVEYAHPVGSILQITKNDFDPNVKWPWTYWIKLRDVVLRATGNDNTMVGGTISTDNTGSSPLPSLSVNMWVRAR